MDQERKRRVYGEVLSVSDVAELLQIEEQTVRALARRGELPGVKLGKHWRFLHDELLASLRPAHRQAPAGPSLRSNLASISQLEAADLLGVSTRTVRRMVMRGQLEKIVAPTGTIRLARSSVQAYLGRTLEPQGGGPEHGD